MNTDRHELPAHLRLDPAAIPQATLDAWQAEGLLELLGQVSDMAALFTSVDMVVQPSYREVVTHEVNGLLVPVKDANAIERLHLDLAWARQLDLAARERAIAEFDERIVIAKTLGVDAKVLTAHVPLPLAQKIDNLAAQLDRPRAWIVKQALAAWVSEEEERHRLTLEGMADVTAGRVVDQADVEAWAASLATGNPLPVPQHARHKP